MRVMDRCDKNCGGDLVRFSFSIVGDLSTSAYAEILIVHHEEARFGRNGRKKI